MRIGFSIQSPALIDSVYNSIYLARYKKLEQFLSLLKSIGVTSIEIRVLERGANPEAFRESIQLIWDMGLEITVHGEIKGNFNGERFYEIYPSMTYILENFKKYQNKLMIPLHAFQSEKADVERLKYETIELLEKWVTVVQTEQLPVYLALENNRNKELVDPGNSVKGVLEIVEEINNPHLGICWDMGHYYSNLLKNKDIRKRSLIQIVELPSDTFLEKVYHTHIHGLNIEGKTHFPLTERQSLPLELYVFALEEKGYQGIYNLELSISRWDEMTNYNKEIKNTIKRLNNVLINL